MYVNLLSKNSVASVINGLCTKLNECFLEKQTPLCFYFCVRSQFVELCNAVRWTGLICRAERTLLPLSIFATDDKKIRYNMLFDAYDLSISDKEKLLIQS